MSLREKLTEKLAELHNNEVGQGGIYIGGGALVIIVIILLLILFL